jgi:hypothetical protein
LAKSFRPGNAEATANEKVLKVPLKVHERYCGVSQAHKSFMTKTGPHKKKKKRQKKTAVRLKREVGGCFCWHLATNKGPTFVFFG